MRGGILLLPRAEGGNGPATALKKGELGLKLR